MARTYYCDYCQRSFTDNAQNRKKHINGVQHKRMMKLHYDSFKDPETILAEESAKKPCRKFQQAGHCDFHPNCRFAHLNEERLKELNRQIQEKREYEEAEKRRMQNEKRKMDANEPNIDQWLAKRKKRKGEQTAHNSAVKPSLKEDSVIEEESNEKLTAAWSLPPSLQGVPNLPPSMIPPTLEDVLDSGEVQWG
ncbi:zinc finger matrin-type protein 5-like [Anneissia japonica]|uniref:zinc finger matrin-type protein 5-like n=1 Tax=Anneissia japonica TaxID=1529436 RepID=UPI0014259566|nr:zinc finger matrin-type protein 5-like [Anneissia japonica]